jgi:molybdenum cofactor cytidylyltransferase
MGKWKPGLPWGERQTIVGCAVSAARSAGCRVIVAGGYRFRTLKRLLTGFDGVTILEAENWEKGMDATIGAALDLVDSDRFFITPADMPLIKPEDYLRLAGVKGADCIRPIFSGVPGHPVLLDSRLIPRLKDVPPGTAFKYTLKSFDVRMLDWDHSGVIRDIDTPSDYTASDS